MRQDHDRSATSAQRSLYAASGNSGAKHPPRFPPTVASSRRRHATPYRRMAARPNALGRGAIRGRQTATIWAVHPHRLSNACRIRPESAHRNGSHCKDAHEAHEPLRIRRVHRPGLPRFAACGRRAGYFCMHRQPGGNGFPDQPRRLATRRGRFSEGRSSTGLRLPRCRGGKRHHGGERGTAKPGTGTLNQSCGLMHATLPLRAR